MKINLKPHIPWIVFSVLVFSLLLYAGVNHYDKLMLGEANYGQDMSPSTADIQFQNDEYISNYVDGTLDFGAANLTTTGTLAAASVTFTGELALRDRLTIVQDADSFVVDMHKSKYFMKFEDEDVFVYGLDSTGIPEFKGGATIDNVTSASVLDLIETTVRVSGKFNVTGKSVFTGAANTFGADADTLKIGPYQDKYVLAWYDENVFAVGWDSTGIWEGKGGGKIDNVTSATVLDLIETTVRVTGNFTVNGIQNIGTSGAYYAATTGDNIIGIYATDATGTGYTDGVSSILKATGGDGNGALRPIQASATADAGANLAELYGVSAYATQSDGSIVTANAYAVMGWTQINETGAAHDPTGYIAGVLGIYDTPGINPSVTLTTPGAKAAVLGVIKDNANTSPHAAVMAFMEGDATGTACPAAFKAVSVRSTAGGGFTYGLDLKDEAGYGHNIITADIRLQNEETISNDVNGTIKFNGAVNFAAAGGTYKASVGILGGAGASGLSNAYDLGATAGNNKGFSFYVKSTSELATDVLEGLYFNTYHGTDATKPAPSGEAGRFRAYLTGDAGGAVALVGMHSTVEMASGSQTTGAIWGGRLNIVLPNEQVASGTMAGGQVELYTGGASTDLTLTKSSILELDLSGTAPTDPAQLSGVAVIDINIPANEVGDNLIFDDAASDATVGGKLRIRINNTYYWIMLADSHN